MNDTIESIEHKIDLLEADLSTALEQTIYHLFKAALNAGKKGNYPVAAGIVTQDQSIVSIGSNHSFYPKPNSGAHAESLALDDFENHEKGDITQHSMILTLEPCLMCTARLTLSGIPKVRYLLKDPAGGGVQSMQTAPDDFRLLASKMVFEPITVNQQINDIAQDLYDLGELIWKEHLSL